MKVLRRATARNWSLGSEFTGGAEITPPAHWSGLRFGFGRDVELAIRAGIMILVQCIPGAPPDFFGQGAVIPFVFVLWKSVGATLRFAFQCIVANLLASAYIWFMVYAIDDDCATDCSYAYRIQAVILGLLFTMLVMWLNLDILSKQFAMFNFAGYFMDFLNPSKNRVHLLAATHLNLKFAICGSVFAVLTSLLPYPLWAHAAAKQTAREVANQVIEVWGLCADVFLSDKQDIYGVSRAEFLLKTATAQYQDIQNELQSAWFERLPYRFYTVCFHSASRSRLLRLVKSFQEHLDHLQILCTICRREHYDPAHFDFTKKMRNDAVQSMASASKLFFMMLERDLSCVVGSSTDADIAEAIADARDGMQQFTCTYKEYFNSRTLSQEADTLIEERTFALQVCAFGRIVVDCADSLDDGTRDPNKKKKGNMREILGKPFNRKVLFSPRNIFVTFHNVFALILGISFGLIDEEHSRRKVVYDAGIASTVAMLLSATNVGSIANNLKRIQGVVVGTVAGSLAYSAFRDCEPVHRLVSGFIVMTWTWATLLTRYYSEEQNMLGKLLAVFGVRQMLQACNGLPSPAKNYNTIKDNAVSVFIFVALDAVIFGFGLHDRYSTTAHAVYMKLWGCIQEVVKKVYHPIDGGQKIDFYECDQLLARAHETGISANGEIRFWRSAWRNKLFMSAVRTAEHIVAILKIVNDRNIVPEKADKHKSIRTCMSVPLIATLPETSIDEIRFAIIDKLHTLEPLLSIFIHEHEGPFEAVRYRRQVSPTDEVAMPEKLLRSWASENTQSMQLDNTSVEYDVVAQISLVLVSTELVIKELQDFRRKIHQA